MKFRSGFRFAVWLALIPATVTAAWSQETVASNAAPAAAQPTPGPAATLYSQLSTVGLDEARVYHVRDAPLNQSAVHLNFDNGTIAFTRDVAGKVTGAFFEGEGEVLLAPPTQLERSSLVVFTGAAILEEKFNTAYFRFNDDTFEQLQPFMKPADAAKEFVSEWDETARNLAAVDALRLLITFTSSPSADARSRAYPESEELEDRFFHARVQGRRLGPFDVLFDNMSPEQVWAGQARTADGNVYYDLWTSFMPVANSRSMTGEIDAGHDYFSVLAYKVRTEIKLPKSISAQADLQIEVRQGGERTLLFELSRFLQVKQVTADGHPVEFIHNPAVEGTQLARRGNDLVAVVFPQPLREGQHTNLRFVYEGDVLSEAGGGLLYVGARGTWFPNRRFAMSNFDLEFHYPAGWTLLATGTRVEDTSDAKATVAEPANPSGEQVSRWISPRPIPVAGFNLGKYHKVSAHAGKVEVEAYAAAGVEESFPKAQPDIIATMPALDPRQKRDAFVMSSPPPPSPARNAQTVADASAQAVDFFSRLFGPYPYQNLALTQNPGTMSQGWPGLVFLSSYAFLTNDERAQLHMDEVERTLSSMVVAHETAHQWWGDLVGWDSYHDQWMVEALANYSSLMLLDTRDPRLFQEVLDKYRDNLLLKNHEGHQIMEAGPVTLGARLSNSHYPDGYDAISYGRGTWLLHMLRSMMRDAAAKAAKSSSHPPAPADEPFIRALRKLREQSEGKEITTRDLLAAFEAELPRPLWHDGQKSLDWFYQGWIQGTAIPHYQLRDVKFSDAGGSTEVSGTLLQMDAPDPLVTPVPVYAVAGNRMAFLGSVFADGPETQFKLTAPRGMRKLALDPNQTLLSRK